MSIEKSTATFDRKIAVSSVKDLQKLTNCLEADTSARVLNKPVSQLKIGKGG